MVAGEQYTSAPGPKRVDPATVLGTQTIPDIHRE